MSRGARLRQRLARRLDPAAYEAPPVSTSTPALASVSAARLTEPPAGRGRDGDGWPAVGDQIALRMLAVAGQMLGPLEEAQAREDDPGQLDRLYRLDHGLARMRRQAENLMVLAGTRVDDAGRQTTSLLDVVRAATSAIEHYPRVQVGLLAPLAVVEYAADDVIRILTELLDNATRYSPAPSPALIAAHLTSAGDVMVRIEDSGYGAKLLPDLAGVNTTLAMYGRPTTAGSSAAHLGLLVVCRLARTHGIRVRLGRRPTGGTTATVLIPARLVCEIPLQPPPAPTTNSSSSRPPAQAARPLAAARPADAAPASRVRPAPHDHRPGAAPPSLSQPGKRPDEVTAGGLPRRQPASTRTTPPAASPAPASVSAEQRHVRVREIAEFDQDVDRHRKPNPPIEGTR